MQCENIGAEKGQKVRYFNLPPNTCGVLLYGVMRCLFNPSHLQKPWADKELGEKGFRPKWNTLDGDINRASHQVGIVNIICGF